jgi:hypothetical protein
VITDGVGLNITVFSYRDHLDFGITADRAAVGDVWPQWTPPRALDELRELIASPPRAPNASKPSSVRCR